MATFEVRAGSRHRRARYLGLADRLEETEVAILHGLSPWFSG